MGMIVEHIQQRGQSYRYRRKVPQGLRPVLGKGEIVIPLGKTKTEALKAYGQAHKKAILAQAWDEARGVTKTPEQPPTARELFREALDQRKYEAETARLRDLSGVKIAKQRVNDLETIKNRAGG